MFMGVVLSFTAFAQDASSSGTKYKSLDMLLGYDVGVGFNMSGDVFDFKKGFFIFTMDLGINYEFYILSWLSVGTGLGLHENMSLVLKDDIANIKPRPDLKDLMRTPVCITFPFNLHVTTPRLEWLYFGVGANVNIPIFSIMDTASIPSNIDLPDTKGSVFVSLPIDVGFDFGHSDNECKRFLLRVTPTFLEIDTLVTYGIFYQKNWKVFRAK
jgi:hypothetical protein